MRSKLFFLTILPLFFLAPLKCFSQSNLSTADEVLRKTSAKLASLKTLKYKYRQEYNYASESYFRETSAEGFLDFAPVESVHGLRFQFTNQDIFIAYNGSESFNLSKKNKTIQIESAPKVGQIFSSTYLQFSPLMWRNALPKIINDKSISKTIRETKINDINCYLVEFTLDKKFIDSGNGDILPMTLNRKSIYRLTIDKKTLLPLEVYRGNSENQDFNKARFSEIIENPAPPIENSWYYSTYLNEYKLAEKPKYNLIKIGETAHELNLPLFGNNKTVSLDDFKGKLVLLEFWIFHCGYCQAAVPKLNELQKKFANKNFKLLTVNVADSEKLVRLFVQKNKAEFPILYNGKTVGEKYGVANYPTTVLIGKDGKILYSGGFDNAIIEFLINQNL